MIHYYLHYGNPSSKHLYHMKRYHYQHHFVHHDQGEDFIITVDVSQQLSLLCILGFGISSPLWDHVFKTDIELKKLKFRLKW